jgi:hypothetical protein
MTAATQATPAQDRFSPSIGRAAPSDQSQAPRTSGPSMADGRVIPEVVHPGDDPTADR